MPTTNGKRPVVVLGMPVASTVSYGFLQAITRALCDQAIDWRPLPIGNTVVHLARDQMIKATLETKDADFLVMVDSDQVWHHATIRRLVLWDVPVVAPVVVQRNGDPIPVAYREVVQDDKGYWRYEPLTVAIAAYLRCYNPARWEANAAAVMLLPPEHDFPDPKIEGLPQGIRDGLDHPLLPVDALGTGMICLRRDVLQALEPDKRSGLYVSFQEGGEDFELSRRVRQAGWWGIAPQQGGKGHGLFVDRGALVGHLTQYSRGVGDLLDYYQRMALAETQADGADQELATAPPATELAARLRERAGVAR